MPLPEDATEREKRAELQRVQLASDVKAVLGTPEGRRLLHHVIDRVCLRYGNAYSPEASERDYMLGRQAAGILLEQLLRDASAQGHAQMLREAIEASLAEP